MSPEQAGSRAVDARTDVYSLGATLYEVLTLRTPFHAKDVAGVLQRIRNEEPRAPRRLDGRVPRDLETIVLKAMEKDPARRYQSAGAIAQDLRHFAADAAIRARRVGLVERAWRGAKRHRALTSVVAVAALLAASAAVLGARAAREADARREMAYARLCNAAEAAQARGIIGVHDGGVMIDGAETDAAHRLLAEAIALLPDRPEAYFVRTLTRGSRSGRRADLEAARARGLGKRSCHLVQAWLLGLDKKYDQAKEEEQQARLCVGPASAADRYFDGRILFLRRQDREAVDAFTAAIRDAPLGGLVRTMSLYVRGLARERARDFGGAIEDAAAVRNAGDSRPEIRVRLASLWRRAGQAVRSEALFDDVLSDVRARGNVDEWDELCLACRASQETVWLDRASEEALRSFGNDPWIVRDRAMAYVDTNRHEEGLAVLAKASTSDLLDDDLRRWRGCMYLGLKRAEEALADFDQVLARFPRRVCALLGRGQAHEALYRDAEALAAYRAAVEADPYREDAHLALGSLLCDRVHDYDAAASEFREAIRLAPHSEAAHLFLGNALKNKRDVVGAVSEYREAIRCAPESALAHRYLGLALVAQGAVANALTEFREAIRLDPRSAEAHQDLASLLHQNGETDEAIAECREAVRLNPDDGELHGILGFLLGQAGDVTGKLLELREAVRLRPKDPLTHGRLGVALGRNGDNGGAIAELREAIRLEPGDPTTHFHLGIGLQTEGDADGAIAECREAIRLKPDYADAHASLGALLMNSRSDPEDALAEFDRCLAVDGRNAFAHRNRGQVLRALDRCEEALDAYDRALALDPACMDARIWHGLALERLERPDEALADYVRAEHDSPGHWKPPTWRAFVLVTLGRAAEALAATEHAIHLDGKNPLCREARWRALAALGRHEDALATCDDALRVLPDSLLFRRRQVMTLRRLGRATEAVERAAHGVGAEPNRGDALDAAYLCAVAGRATEARTLLKEGERLADREDSFDRARVFAVLAEWEHALHWLEIAATKSFHLPANHAPEPDFDFISGNPRFVAAMAKIVLP